MKTLSLILALFILPLHVYAVTFEVDFDFGYDKQIYGTKRQNSIVTRTYSGGLAAYLFNLTALELNASRSYEVATQNEQFTVATGFDLTSDRNTVTTDVYGIGLKQMLAGRNSFIVPVISFGYAKEFLEYGRKVTILNTTDSTSSVKDLGTTKQEIHSMFGAFILQFRMTDRLSLKASIKTLFPANDYNKAKDNLKYSVGFSWIF